MELVRFNTKDFKNNIAVKQSAVEYNFAFYTKDGERVIVTDKILFNDIYFRCNHEVRRIFRIRVGDNLDLFLQSSTEELIRRFHESEEINFVYDEK